MTLSKYLILPLSFILASGTLHATCTNSNQRTDQGKGTCINGTPDNSILQLPSCTDTRLRQGTSTCHDATVDTSQQDMWLPSCGPGQKHLQGTDQCINGNNLPPTADAGIDQTVEVNHTLLLDGSASSDPDGSITSYEWKEGNTVLSTNVSFNYQPDITGIHTLLLTVTDNDGATATDSINIKVTKHQPLIIIRVEFNDYQFRSDAATWSSKIFGSGASELNDYYNEISYGIFQFVKASESDGTANDGIITIHLNENHPGNVNDFDKRLITAAEKADPYIDYSQYDSDGNGKISRDELQLMFLVAGGESATGASPGVWAHQWCFYGGNGDAPTLDGVKLMDCNSNGDFSRFGEKMFDANNGDDATIGVIAHELGHAVFRLPDLYDTDGSSSGIGNFGLMGGGSWGRKSGENPGQTPVHMTGWSKAFTHFISPVTVDNANQLEANATASDHFTLYKVETGIAQEYFLIENRAAKGYDLGLHVLQRNSGDYQGGMLITHIDDTKNTNSDETHKLVDIEEADGNTELDDKSNRGRDEDLFYNGNNNAFTPTSNPNSDTYDDGVSGVSITNISPRGDIMTFDIHTQ